METAARQDKLHNWQQRVQQELQLRQSADIQVWCKLSSSTLLVLVQHGADPVDRQQTFHILQQALVAQPLPAVRQVRMFLRVAGQKQPYADRDFTIISQVVPGEAQQHRSVVFLPRPQQSSASGLGAQRWGSYIINHLQTSRQKGWRLTGNHLLMKPKVLASTDSRSRSKPKLPSRLGLLLIVTGVGIGIVSFLGAFYALTRPCTLSGRCVPIETASELISGAAATAENEKNSEELKLALEKLVTATQELEKIPMWSGHHPRAQQLLESNQRQAQNLDLMVRGMDKAMSAAIMSQEPPHPVEKWQEMKLLWQQAIALLSIITPDSYVYELRSQKLQEYGANLVAIDKRLQLEKEAIEQLEAAKELASIALARQGIAQTLENWQLVQATWSEAVNKLSAVNKGTRADLEAQQLWVAYQSGLASARDRQTREEFSATTYQEALRLAKLAQSFSEQQEYGQAVSNWRLALTYAQQVPKDSFHYPVAQPLISSYSASLAAAEVQLKVALVLKTTRAHLERTCVGVPTICEYNVTENLITVQLKPEYVRAVKETFITAGNRGDYDTLVNMDEHLDSLRAALQAISDNADIPIELYDQYGQLKGSYVPNRS